MDIRTPTSPENLAFNDFRPAQPEAQLSFAASSMSSNTASSSTMTSARAVVENAKIFPLFAKRLASHDVKDYTSTANKLKHWLSSEKAYYLDALCNIISLLEIAHETFVKEFMNTESLALAAVDTYQALICAVIPFSHRFGEGDLQIRLKHLIQSSSEVLTRITRPVRAEGEATLQEFKNTPSVTTSARDATPGTQLMFPIAQVQSPTTMQGFTSDTPADPRPSVASPTTNVSKPQPKRLGKGPSLSKNLKNRDLEWFKTHQQSASSVVDAPAQPGMLESMTDATGTPAAERLRPSRMPRRIPPRPRLSEQMASTELTAPVNAVDRSTTSPSSDVPAPTYVEVPEEEDIAPAVTDVIMSDLQPESVHEDSEVIPLHALESTVPEVTVPEIATLSLKSNTDSPPPIQPLPTSSDAVSVESREGDQLMFRVDDAPTQITSKRFGGEMAVMVFRQGLQSPRGTLKINFNLDETHYAQISRWAKRKSSPIDLEQSVCVSFACYHLPSLLPNPPEDGEIPSFETLTMHTSCAWPTTGDLSLQTERDGKDFVIPLAPPLFLTPDNCVDLSAFIRNGENAFSVVQQSDMSEYVFMLHAHHPTPAQLSYAAECRRGREEWARTIRTLLKPEPTESLWMQQSSRS